MRIAVADDRQRHHAVVGELRHVIGEHDLQIVAQPDIAAAIEHCADRSCVTTSRSCSGKSASPLVDLVIMQPPVSLGIFQPAAQGVVFGGLKLFPQLRLAVVMAVGDVGQKRAHLFGGNQIADVVGRASGR